jgi:hypothetical protein
MQIGVEVILMWHSVASENDCMYTMYNYIKQVSPFPLLLAGFSWRLDSL